MFMPPARLGSMQVLNISDTSTTHAGWREYLTNPLEVFDGAIVIVSCGSVTSHRWINLNMLRMFRQVL